MAPITTAPFLNYQGDNSALAPLPAPPQGYTPNAFQANSQLFYQPAPFNVNGQAVYRQPWTSNALTEGFIHYFPGQPLGSAPISYFNGISAENLNVGSSTVTSALNNVNFWNNTVDQIVASNVGLLPPNVDPYAPFLFVNPQSGGLPNINGQPVNQPVFTQPGAVAGQTPTGQQQTPSTNTPQQPVG